MYQLIKIFWIFYTHQYYKYFIDIINSLHRVLCYHIFSHCVIKSHLFCFVAENEGNSLYTYIWMKCSFVLCIEHYSWCILEYTFWNFWWSCILFLCGLYLTNIYIIYLVCVSYLAHPSPIQIACMSARILSFHLCVASPINFIF